jgi:hypothetical protein
MIIIIIIIIILIIIIIIKGDRKGTELVSGETVPANLREC